MKIKLPILLLATVVIFSAGCSKNDDAAQTANIAPKETIIGACVYNLNDGFIKSIAAQMTFTASEEGAEISVMDSQKKQPVQNEQINNFIEKNVTALAVNPVDREEASSLIEKARRKNIPIVFFNRELDKESLNGYEKAWYVGSKAEESGTMSGEIIADYWLKNKSAADKNGDGKLQYIMLMGEEGHQDTVLRTEYSLKAVSDAGIETVEISRDFANWDRTEAKEKVSAIIADKGAESVEAVICNNDDMALGAIDAMKTQGYNAGDDEKFIPVVGVNATREAVAAMKEGSLLGSAINDGKNQGKAIINIITAAARGENVDNEQIGYDITDGKYVWIPYVKITADNYKNFDL